MHGMPGISTGAFWVFRISFLHSVRLFRWYLDKLPTGCGMHNVKEVRYTIDDSTLFFAF